MTDNSRLYAERQKRFEDVVALRKPDRLPFMPELDYFPARRCGISIREAMYNPEAMERAWLSYYEKYQPDQADNPFRMRGFGRLLEALDFQHLKWAGHGLGDDMPYQFVEMELLKDDEYDHFLSDQSDFMVRRYWPRVFKALAPLAKLPPLRGQISYFWGLYTPAMLMAPEFRAAAEALWRAADECARIGGLADAFGQKLKELGFPMLSGGYTQVPFDTLGDVFRSARGLLTDLRRRPEKVLAACEKLLPVMIEAGINGARESGTPITYIPLHKCLDNFISQDQFERFYWPHMKIILNELISNGITPWVQVEGVCNTRLKTFSEVPSGKVVYHLEGSDMALAKDIFRGKACLRGNLPISVMVTGTPDEVRVVCKKLLNLMMPDGGFIPDFGVNLGDAKPENVDAAFDYIREHGVY